MIIWKAGVPSSPGNKKKKKLYGKLNVATTDGGGWQKARMEEAGNK